MISVRDRSLSGLYIPRDSPSTMVDTYSLAPKMNTTRLVFQSDQTLTRSVIITDTKVQECDGGFFERFASLSNNIELRKRDLLHSEGHDSRKDDKQKQELRRLSVKFSRMTELKQDELEKLYIEVLYTIRHRVGKTTIEHTPFEDDLIFYVQEAFRMDDSMHLKLLEMASTEKESLQPPVVLLNVIVIEASDLVAKDPNGFSDPFVMLGVIPGKRRRNEVPSELQGTNEQVESTDTYTSVLHRFGGSLHGRHWSNSKKERNSPDVTSIPAKLIKATSVQEATLNPKWNEKFQFIVEDVQHDHFHVDIWDHDDEERSVLDAVAKLNQISGIRGLGRYFKQVTQSARASGDESVDDFLGCTTISLKNVPSTGVEDWIALKPRSEKSKVSGRIRLKLWLSTKEERPRGENEEDNLTDVRQHQALIGQFTQHQIRRSCVSISFAIVPSIVHFQQDPILWGGSFPQTAFTLLHQHAIQGDLTELQQAMCFWLAYLALHQDVGLSYEFLWTTLNSLLEQWTPTILSKDEEDIIAESFTLFLSLSCEQFLDNQQMFPLSKEDTADQLVQMLRCLVLLYESALFHKCLPFQRELKSELISLTKKNAIRCFQNFQDASNQAFPDNPLRALTDVIIHLNAFCSIAQKYNEIINSAIDFCYFSLTYRELDRLLESAMDEKLMDVNQESLMLIFELHMSLKEFMSFREQNKEMLKINAAECDLYLENAINQWLDLIKMHAFGRMDMALIVDKKIPVVNTEICLSSSYVDICHLLQQVSADVDYHFIPNRIEIMEFWEHLSVSNVNRQAELMTKLVKNICSVTEYYTERLFDTAIQSGVYTDCDQNGSKLCETLNNMEQIRRALGDVRDRLQLDELAIKLQSTQKHVTSWHSQIESAMEMTTQNLLEHLDLALGRVAQSHMEQLRRHVFHLVWSPAGCAFEQTFRPLVSFLDADLVVFHRWLLHRNFARLLVAQFRTVITLIRECVDDNPGVGARQGEICRYLLHVQLMEPDFYHRLFDAINILADFFHANGKGIAIEIIKTLESYKLLMALLSLNETSTINLIEQYYSDLLKQQMEVNECKYGILNIRAYYNPDSETLVVDVIGAKHVIPLDLNGLSDPFVIVELVPAVHYPLVQTIRTKVVNKSLNPLFNETFELYC